MDKKMILAIVGPTGVGKTRAAEEIQKRLRAATGGRPYKKNGELISVDSRQVYRGMDIGTGKDARIFGTDLVRPDKLFSVADYARIVKPHIQRLLDAGKLPILVGGTGLYLKALIDGIDTIDVPPDLELRKKLEKMTVEELQKLLRSLDPPQGCYALRAVARLRPRTIRCGARGDDKGVGRCGMNNSDWMNPRRLVRKIEIMKYHLSVGGDLPVAPHADRPGGLSLQINKLVIIGLTAPLSTLKNNIEKRVKGRLDRGLLEEIRGLLKEYGWNEVLRSTIAYREWEDYFNKKYSYEETVARWTRDEVNYAKRQLTWFKKDKRVKWIAASHGNREVGQILNAAGFDGDNCI